MLGFGSKTVGTGIQLMELTQKTSSAFCFILTCCSLTLVANSCDTAASVVILFCCAATIQKKQKQKNTPSNLVLIKLLTIAKIGLNVTSLIFNLFSYVVLEGSLLQLFPSIYHDLKRKTGFNVFFFIGSLWK